MREWQVRVQAELPNTDYRIPNTASGNSFRNECAFGTEAVPESLSEALRIPPARWRGRSNVLRTGEPVGDVVGRALEGRLEVRRGDSRPARGRHVRLRHGLRGRWPGYGLRLQETGSQEVAPARSGGRAAERA